MRMIVTLRYVVSGFVFLSVLLGYVGCKEKAGSSTPAGVENTMGKNVFNINCASCHGPTGEGDGPAAVGFNPRNFVKDKFKNGSSLEAVIKTLGTGIAGTQMVPFKGILSDKQIKAVAEYVLELKASK